MTENKGLDYVALLATVVLGAVACVALVYGYEAVAGTAVGAVAGYVIRMYR